MEFTPEDFKRLMYNVYEASDKIDFTETFPELNLYEEFKAPLIIDKTGKTLNRNRIIRYIVYVYDKNSPYRIKYKDIMQRKVRAMVDAGYPLTEGNVFPDYIEEILEGKNHKVCDMIIAFVKLHCDMKYRHLVLLENIYYKKEREVYISGSTDIKISDLTKIKESYELTQKELLMEDQDRGLLKSLYKSLRADKINLSPEDIALSLKNKGVEETVNSL